MTAGAQELPRGAAADGRRRIADVRSTLERRAGRPYAATGAEHLVTVADPEDMDTIADVLAEAFTGYPWTDWIIPADDRSRRLRALHRADLAHVGLPHGTVWVARCPASGLVVGAIAVLRPDRPVPAAAWAQVQEAESDLLGDRRADADRADALLADVRPDEPVVVVATMGVAADHRRRGIARRLLDEAMRVADGLRAPAYLETSSTGNVALYSAAGFVVTGHVIVPDGGPEVWAMRREARTHDGAAGV